MRQNRCRRTNTAQGGGRSRGGTQEPLGLARGDGIGGCDPNPLPLNEQYTWGEGGMERRGLRREPRGAEPRGRLYLELPHAAHKQAPTTSTALPPLLLRL